MSDTSYILGIDLGTTYSACTVMQSGEPVMIPNAIGEYLTPSVVSVDDNGDILVGAPALARIATHPEQTAAHFKRDMGTDTKLVLGDHKMSPEELSAIVLAELKRDAESALGMTFSEAVVTVPAYFGERQRQATRDAAAIAGLSAERIINEPTAAAMAYGLHDLGREVVAVVLDLGGGTFDVTVIELLEGVIEVQSTAGDTRLGGEDFADTLAEHLVARLASEQEAIVEDQKSLARLRAAAEDAKRSLSSESSARIALPDLQCKGGVRDVELAITRDEMEKIWEPLLERIKLPIHRALRDAKLGREGVEEVILVGGATRMPCFRDLAAKLFSRLPAQHIEPDTAVAKGAAIQAALKAGDKSVEDMVVTDVAPFTMGISTVTTIGSRNVEGMYSPIIERGTVIPASRSDVFSTMSNNQTHITIEVYQGEHSLCAQNQKLGEYTVKGLPKKPAGECNIDVRFTYDLNGLLEVDMSVVGTKKKGTLLIQQKPGQLSAKELAAARERMVKLKFHPRETLPNRTALSRGDALYAELAGEARQVLGHALGQMRGALETQDPSIITEARENLTSIISSLGSARG